MEKEMLPRFTTVNAGLVAVISVSAIFIISRLAMPIIFDGSYIDEYWHIISGISLFESGNYANFYNHGKPYERGLLMSLWVGFWMALFGKSILVAKLAPISIGILSYFLFLYLSLKLFDQRRFQILLLLLYTLSPWSIFNHYYIRMYVVYELFLLILLVLGYKMYNAMRDANEKKTILFLSLIFILNFLNLTTNADHPVKYILPVASAVMLASLFIYEFHTPPKTNRGLYSLIAGNMLLSTETYRTVVVLVLSVLAFIGFDASHKIDLSLNAQIMYTSLPEYKYSWLFWKRNGVVTVFFILAVATFWWKPFRFEKILLPVAGVIFLVHIVSGDDLQIIRAITYFFPLYYITAVISVSKVGYPSEWLWYVVISSMFLLATVTNVQKNFWPSPGVTTEVYYIEYAKLYDAVRKNCSGHLVVEAAPSAPMIAKFYGVIVDYALSAAGHAERNTTYFLDANTGRFKTVWGELPVITDIHDLKRLNRDVCLIVRGPSKPTFYPSTAQGILQSAKKSWHFHNIALYLLGQENLTGER